MYTQHTLYFGYAILSPSHSKPSNCSVPHSYMQKSIPNRLRRWDFCLQACVLLRSAQRVRRPTEQLPNQHHFANTGGTPYDSDHQPKKSSDHRLRLRWLRHCLHSYAEPPFLRARPFRRQRSESRRRGKGYRPRDPLRRSDEDLCRNLR